MPLENDIGRRPMPAPCHDWHQAVAPHAWRIADRRIFGEMRAEMAHSIGSGSKIGTSSLTSHGLALEARKRSIHFGPPRYNRRLILMMHASARGEPASDRRFIR